MRSLLPKDQVEQKDNVRAMFVQGHASNSITRIPELMKGLQELELLVVADPHPTTWASLAVKAGRKDNMYLLPVCTQFEAHGSRVASNRSMQWGEQIVKPIFELKDDLEVMYLIAKKLGFADQMFKNIKVENNLPVAEDILREMNRGSWSTGYCGQSPERHQSAHGEPGKVRSGHHAGAEGRPGGGRRLLRPALAVLGLARGQASRARRCSTTTDAASMDGGGTFRARFGVTERSATARRARSACWPKGPISQGSEIKDGYPEFTLGVFKKLGWDKDLTADEIGRHREDRAAPDKADTVSWSTDLSGGIQRVCDQAWLSCPTATPRRA